MGNHEVISSGDLSRGNREAISSGDNDQSSYQPIKTQTSNNKRDRKLIDLQTPINSFIQNKNNADMYIFVNKTEEKDIGLIITTTNNKEYILSKYNEEYDLLKQRLVPKKYYIINGSSDLKHNYLNSIINDDVNMIEITIENIKTNKETGDTEYLYKNSETDTKNSYLINERNGKNYCKIYNLLVKDGTYQIFYDSDYNILFARPPEIRKGNYKVRGSILLHGYAGCINTVNFPNDVYEIIMDNYDGNRYFRIVRHGEGKSGFKDNCEYFITYEKTFRYNCFKILSFGLV